MRLCKRVVLGFVFGLFLVGSLAGAAEVCDGSLAAEGGGYQGAEFCVMCHYDAESYMQTAHASKVQGPPSASYTPVLRTKIGGEEVSVFDPQGRFLGIWGRAGAGRGEFAFPAGLCADQCGSLYVVDLRNHRIQQFKITT